jgi:diadenosine tetraphosphate (Ap4A) HIT family hydrolase
MRSCSLCDAEQETVLWSDAQCRVVLVNEPDYSGYCRVIWHEHLKEMTDLTEIERAHLMQIVFLVEQILREIMHPEKINLASLGNQVPHVHWHIIPRFTDDAHFPDPVWSVRKRDSKSDGLDRAILTQRLRQRFAEIQN